MEQKEVMLYGSKRLGTFSLEGIANMNDIKEQFSYELTDHPGNVRATVNGLGNALSATDYYPFGMPMINRALGNYRFGFNGKEEDGETGFQNYGFRFYNPALARFFTVDPLSTDYPELSTYQFASNTPVWAVDLDGLEGTSGMGELYKSFGTTKTVIMDALNVVGIREGEPIITPQRQKTELFLKAAINATFGIATMAGAVGAATKTGGQSMGAFPFGFSETAIGVGQMVDAFGGNGKPNSIIHNSSSVPGLIAHKTGSENADLIDAAGQLFPSLSAGKGIIDDAVQLLVKPNVTDGLSTIDNVLDIQGFGSEIYKSLDPILNSTSNQNENNNIEPPMRIPEKSSK